MGCHPAARPAAQVSCPLLVVIHYSSLFNVLPYPSQPPSPPLFTSVKFYSIEKTTWQELGGKCNKSFFYISATSAVNPDPHGRATFWKPDPDPHQSEKLDEFVSPSKSEFRSWQNWIPLEGRGRVVAYSHHFDEKQTPESHQRLTVGSESEPT